MWLRSCVASLVKILEQRSQRPRPCLAPGCPSADKFNATDSLPCINMRMTSVLIEFGADINYQNKKDGFTIWEEFLRQGLTKLSFSLRADSYSPDFARLMGFFLRSGANPHEAVKFECLCINLLEFLETYVRLNYFTEADHLHDEILKALKSTPPTPHDGNQDSNTSASSPTSINTTSLSMDEAPILRPSEFESKDHFLPAQDDEELERGSQDLSAMLKSHLRSEEAAPSLPTPGQSRRKIVLHLILLPSKSSRKSESGGRREF